MVSYSREKVSSFCTKVSTTKIWSVNEQFKKQLFIPELAKFPKNLSNSTEKIQEESPRVWSLFS